MRFERTMAQVDKRIEGGEWRGLQCVVLRGEEPVLELAAGQHRPGVEMTAHDRLRWTCSSKVVTAVLCARLADAGLLDLHAPIPGFAREDAAGEITAARLLNHSAGLSETAEEPYLAPYELVAKLAMTEPPHPDFVPGKQRRYSSFANFATLAWLTEQATGRPFTELAAEYVFEPSGATSSGFTGEPAPTWINESGQFRDALGELIPADSLDEVFPGVGCSGPARDLARVVRELSPHSVRRGAHAGEFVTRTAPFVPCDRSGDTAEWGLGFVVGWSRFGRCVSPNSFGHAGCRSSLTMHDPAHDLTVAIIGNTISTSLLRSERVKPFIPAIYDDLEL